VPDRPHVAVIGGGVTGLAAAWFLRASPQPPDVTVIESTPRLGGKIRTEELDGVTVELGADAFVTRQPEAAELCRRLGLGGELVAPAAGGAGAVRIWSGGRLHPLPDGVVLGAPTGLGSLLRSGLLSTAGVARAALDLVLPREVDVDRESVAELIDHRFGPQVTQRLVEPLLAGVYAGDVDRLSAAAATPLLADAARSRRSLLLGLRRRAATDGPLFLTVRGGLQRMVERLAADLSVRRATPAQVVERTPSAYLVRLASAPPLHADGVVLAVPAFAAAALLRQAAQGAADPLREIPYVSVAVVTLVYPPGAGEVEGSGMLVPKVEDRLVKAATWVSSKWPERVPDDRLVIRASVGRRGEDAPLRLDDRDLCGAVHEELREALGLTARPTAARVTRWERALPQYELGHRDRLRRIADGTAHLPGLVLTGAAYEGVGIAACVRQADHAARDVLRALDLPHEP
jgi:oxygen-dependent protoporphyrinogen oxidase